MSLLLVYHDSKRALVCSDDRAISFGENGEAIAMPDRVPKFITVAGLVFACLGTSDVCAKLNSALTRMLADHPQLAVPQLAGILPPGLASTYAKRAQDPNRPIGFDNLEAAIIGYDRVAQRMRSFVFVATDKFWPVEVTANPAARIFALGHYNATDTALLERVTGKMQNADSKGLPWIAAQLRDALEELHEKYPIPVGEPSFYAALDPRGPVELPADFPAAPEVEFAAAAHHVTTNKETAFNGTTRFFLGSILTPKAGAPDTTGNNDGGAGAQYGAKLVYRMSINKIDNPTTGNGLINNQQNATDGDLTTSASLQCVGNSGTNNASIQLSSPPGLWGPFESATLYVMSKASVAGLVGGVINVFTLSYGTVYDGSVPFTGATTVIRSGRSGYGGSTGVIDAISLSLDTNLSKIVVLAAVGTNPPITAGNIALDIYDAWIEVIQ